MSYGRTSGHDLGVFSYQLFGKHSFTHFQQIGVAVQVVKIFQKRKIESFFDVKVFFALCKFRREVYRKLFIPYRMFKLAFIFRFQQRYIQLLILFLHSFCRHFASQIGIVCVACRLVTEPVGFKFRSVHKYNPCFGIRIYFMFVIRFSIILFSVGKQRLNFCGFFFERIHDITSV